jgi:hypothetical protein
MMVTPIFSAQLRTALRQMNSVSTEARNCRYRISAPTAVTTSGCSHTAIHLSCIRGHVHAINLAMDTKAAVQLPLKPVMRPTAQKKSIANPAIKRPFCKCAILKI